jgi:hypothetical protein
MVVGGVTPPFFHPDSSIPPEFWNPEIHCYHRDLIISLEETGGYGASFSE